MVRIRKILFVGLLFLFAGNNYGQMHREIWIDSLMHDQDNPTLVGTYDTIFIRIHLTDSANNWVFGDGDIRYWAQSDSMLDISASPKMINNSTMTEPIPVTGRFDTLYLPVDSLILRTGPVNVIIIWPSIVNATFALSDSGFQFVNEYIYTDVGLPLEPFEEYGSIVFPNPAMAIQLVYVKNKYSLGMDYITITNSLGQVITTKSFAGGEMDNSYLLPTDGLKPGVYYIHIFYEDKKNEVVKFIKN
jgi:hypothetical protein